MVSEGTGSGGNAPPRRTGAGLGRRALRLAGLLFGTPTSRSRRVASVQGGTSQTATERSRLEGREEPLARSRGAPAGEQIEMAALNPRSLSLEEALRRIEDVLEHYRAETRRLSDETSRIALVADRLEMRLQELMRLLERGVALPGGPEEVSEATEPRFLPNEQGLDVVIRAVPGFQELMDAQRGLSALPAVSAAAVHRFQNGEAALEVALSAPLGAREVVEGLREATGHELAIEEARPDAHRLRLRFIDDQDK